MSQHSEKSRKATVVRRQGKIALIAVAVILFAHPGAASAAVVSCDSSCNGQYIFVADDPVLSATFTIDTPFIQNWQWDDGDSVSNVFLSVFMDDVTNDIFFSATINKGGGQLSFLNPIENREYACAAIAGCTATFGSPGSYSVQLVPLPAALPLFAGGFGLLSLLGWRRGRETKSA